MRLINAEKLENSFELSIESWSRDCNSNAPAIANTYKMALKRVKEEPTIDAVEVVRCSSCRFAFIDGMKVFCENPNTPWHNDEFNIYMATDANDFCSYGERRCEE